MIRSRVVLLAGGTVLLVGAIALVVGPRLLPGSDLAAETAPDSDKTNGDDEVANEATGAVPVVVFSAFTTELRASKGGDEAGDGEEHRINLAFDVEVRTLAARDLVEERRAEIRDATIELLADRAPADLRGAENQDRLKQDLLDRIETLVPGNDVKAVYLQQIIVE